LNRLNLWPLLPVTALLLGLGWYFWQESTLAGGGGFPLDDSWIHLTLARNLSNGQGFAVNPGHPVGASTAPLWTLLLAGLFKVIGPCVPAVKYLGLLLTLLGLELIRRLYLAYRPGCRIEAALAAALAALLPSTLWGAMSGLEIPLAILLVSGALLAHARLRGSGSWRCLVPPFLMGLAALTRPEALLVFPLSLLDSPGRSDLKHLLGRSLAFLLPLIPVFLFHITTHGAPLPTTFYAKIHNSLNPAGGQGLFWALSTGSLEATCKLLCYWSINHLGLFLKSLLFASPFLVLLLPLGMKYCITPPNYLNHPLMLPLLALVFVPLAMGIFSPRPDLGAGDRYVSFLNPVIAVLTAAGLFLALRLLPKWAASATVILMVVSLFSAVHHGAMYHARCVKNTEQMHVQLSHWVQKNLPPGSTVAVHDIGALSFHCHHHLLDLVGIATPEFLNHKRNPDLLFSALYRLRPDYLIVAPNWYPDLVRHTDIFIPIHMQQIPPEESLILAGPTMVVYRAEWPGNASGK